MEKIKANKSIFTKLLILFVFLMFFTFIIIALFVTINQSDMISENIKYQSDEYVNNLMIKLEQQNYDRDKIVNELRKKNIEGKIISLNLEKNKTIFENCKKADKLKKYFNKNFLRVLNYKNMNIEYYIPLNKDFLFIRQSIYDLNKHVKKLIRIIIIIFLFVVVIFIFSLVLLRKWIIVPLSRIIKATKSVLDNDYEHQIKIYSDDEFGFVSTVFNEMTKKLNENITMLNDQMKKIKEANIKIKIMATMDELTKLYNRRALFDKLNEDLSRVKRYGKYLGIIMFDIDHFKNVNDTYGHDAGDKILRATASLVAETIREIDYVGRYGGEEFVIVVPNNQLSQVLQMAERVRVAVEQNIVVINETQSLRVTISLGISEFSLLRSDNVKNAESFIKCADKALYTAKETGRNKVDIYNG